MNIQIICHSEHIPVKGNCSAIDNETDVKEEQRILKELEYNQWVWCCIEIQGEFKGIMFSDYLGACSYKDEKDFIDNSGYYEDMINTVKKGIQDIINNVQNVIL